MKGDSRRGEVVFLLRLEFGLGFIFMGLAGILNEVVLRLEMKRWLRGLRGWRQASCGAGAMLAGPWSAMSFPPLDAMRARLMIT